MSFTGLEAADHHRPGHGGGPGGDDEPPTGPAIDLPTVLAHEIGHSLGLGHSNSPACGSEGQPLMCPYYLGPAFELQQEDIDRITGLYPEPETPLDTTNTSGKWSGTQISYSFMPDGTQLEQETVFGRGRPRQVTHVNSLFETLDVIFGTNQWQSIYAKALDLWAEASATDGTGTVLSFNEVTDSGAAFDGNGQQGDIRFGAHVFDGPGSALAHAYFAPPNGNTAAGDAHIDEAENWQDLRSSTTTDSTSTSTRSGPPLGGGTTFDGGGLAVSSLQLSRAMLPFDTADSVRALKVYDDAPAPKRLARKRRN